MCVDSRFRPINIEDVIDHLRYFQNVIAKSDASSLSDEPEYVEYEEYEDEVLSRIFTDGRLTYWVHRQFEIHQKEHKYFFDRERKIKTPKKRNWTMSETAEILNKRIAIGQKTREFRKKMINDYFDDLINELLSFGKDQGPNLHQVSFRDINGVRVYETGRKIECENVIYKCIVGSDAWQILYLCSRSAFEKNPPDDCGKVSVNAVQMILSQRRRKSGLSQLPRNYFHKIVRRINEKWEEKNLRVLRIDEQTNNFVLEAVFL